MARQAHNNSHPILDDPQNIANFLRQAGFSINITPNSSIPTANSNAASVMDAPRCSSSTSEEVASPSPELAGINPPQNTPAFGPAQNLSQLPDNYNLHQAVDQGATQSSSLSAQAAEFCPLQISGDASDPSVERPRNTFIQDVVARHRAEHPEPSPTFSSLVPVSQLQPGKTITQTNVAEVGSGPKHQASRRLPSQAQATPEVTLSVLHIARVRPDLDQFSAACQANVQDREDVPVDYHASFRPTVELFRENTIDVTRMREQDSYIIRTGTTNLAGSENSQDHEGGVTLAMNNVSLAEDATTEGTPPKKDKGKGRAIEDIEATSKKEDKGKGKAVEEDREHQLYFSGGWGKPESRGKPKSQPRTVVISHLPSTATLAQIVSCIYHGPLELIRFKPGDSRAYATFISGRDAQKYHDVTANGIYYMKGPMMFYAFAEISKDNEPVSSKLQEHLDNGASRVVMVDECPLEYSAKALKRVAAEKDRILESLVDRRKKDDVGAVEFRFASIKDAVSFWWDMRKDEDFGGAGALVGFGADPCGYSTGVHVDED